MQLHLQPAQNVKTWSWSFRLAVAKNYETAESTLSIPTRIVWDNAKFWHLGDYVNQYLAAAIL